MNDQTETETSEDILYVLCRNCGPRSPEQTHQTRSGERPDFRFHSWTFRENAYTPIPRAHGMQFLKDEAFVVATDPDGKNVIPPLTKQNGDGKLKDHQIVAGLDELTIDALLKRASVEPGGEKMRRQDGKEALIAFLTKVAKQRRIGTDDDGLKADANTEPMAKDELDRIFEAA